MKKDKELLDTLIFTRITKNTDEMLEQLAESQERTKSFILRKALQSYLQLNNSQI